MSLPVRRGEGGEEGPGLRFVRNYACVLQQTDSKVVCGGRGEW